jgi:hypothetical protein
MGVDEVCDPMGDHPRLAAPGAGEDQERPLDVGYRLPLAGVQTFKEVHENSTGWGRNRPELRLYHAPAFASARMAL